MIGGRRSYCLNGLLEFRIEAGPPFAKFTHLLDMLVIVSKRGVDLCKTEVELICDVRRTLLLGQFGDTEDTDAPAFEPRLPPKHVLRLNDLCHSRSVPKRSDVM